MKSNNAICVNWWRRGLVFCLLVALSCVTGVTAVGQSCAELDEQLAQAKMELDLAKSELESLEDEYWQNWSKRKTIMQQLEYYREKLGKYYETMVALGDHLEELPAPLAHLVKAMLWKMYFPTEPFDERFAHKTTDLRMLIETNPMVVRLRDWVWEESIPKEGKLLKEIYRAQDKCEALENKISALKKQIAEDCKEAPRGTFDGQEEPDGEPVKPH